MRRPSLDGASASRLFLLQLQDKYRPRHEACAYSLALGMVRPLNPTHFKIVDGSLLLFHVNEEKDGLFGWNNSTISEEELMRRASGNQFLIKF